MNCNECDHPTCRLGDFVRKTDGCERLVPEELWVEHYHWTQEIMPMIRSYPREQQTQIYKDTLKLLYKVYAQPVAKKIGSGHWQPEQKLIDN